MKIKPSFSVSQQMRRINKFIRINGEEIPVSEEVYRAYYRPEWAERKRQERENRCRNADGNRCTENCELCDRKPDGGILSLDKFVEDGFDVPSEQALVDEIVADKLLLDELYEALAEMTDDERSLVDAIYFKSQSERALSEETGVPRKTLSYRRDKILDKLRRLLEKNK